MRAVLMERMSVWDRLAEKVGGEKKVVGKCGDCRKSQAKKDAERRVAMAEMAGQEEDINEADLEAAVAPLEESKNEWCCMYRVLSLQQDFVDEKPMIQHFIEGKGHLCFFYPKFHCEFNPIEMLWGYGKYRKVFFISSCRIVKKWIQVFDWPQTENSSPQKSWSRSASIRQIPTR